MTLKKCHRKNFKQYRILSKTIDVTEKWKINIYFKTY